MRRLPRPVLLSLGVAAVLFVAAGVWWFARLPPMRLTRSDFADLPGWQTGDPTRALSAFRRSCAVIARAPPLEAMGGAGYAGTNGDWGDACAEIPTTASPEAARRFFENNFVPFSVESRVPGLFTGYYEPEILGSRTRQRAYQTPVYGRPGDLVDVNLGQFLPALHGEHIAGHVVGKNLVPYATRADIDGKGAAGAPVLFFAKDPIGVFFLEIQGSGRVRFQDGQMARVAYDGQNGRPYTAIGRGLIASGAIARKDVSLATIRAWLESHPDAARALMETDQSFVFFRETPLDDPLLGSAGTEGVPLTAEASLAVDPRLHPMGAPFFVATALPEDGTWDRLMIAQDTGGAIRGAVRGDIFFGFGQTAEARAGAMKAAGKVYVLLPKKRASALPRRTDFSGLGQ